MIIKSKKAFWKNYVTIFTRMLLSSIGVRPMDTLNKDSETMTHFTLYIPRTRMVRQRRTMNVSEVDHFWLT